MVTVKLYFQLHGAIRFKKLEFGNELVFCKICKQNLKKFDPSGGMVFLINCLRGKVAR
jgi:hypothetical protein